MRLPNGYGGISKLPGNRRKPWRVRVTEGWKLVDNQAKQQYKILGYYSTRKEAMEALALYNSGKPLPQISAEKHTIESLFDKWFDIWEREKAQNTSRVLLSSWKAVMEPHQYKYIEDMRLSDYELIFRQSGRTQSVLSKCKTALVNVYEYAYRHEIVSSDQVNSIKYLEPKYLAQSEEKKNPHTIFTSEEIEILWQHTDDPRARLLLILIYTGMRAGEYAALKQEHVQNGVISIVKAKTSAGIRMVPIADKIAPIFELSRYGNSVNMNYHIKLLCEEIGIQEHSPHDCRHTCISMLVAAEVDDRIIKLLVGHSGNGDVTFSTYTHANVEKLREAINKI